MSESELVKQAKKGDKEALIRLVIKPLGTVKSRISIGLATLRELLGGDYS